MTQRKYIIPKGTEGIAYRRTHDPFGRPTIEKKEHVLRRDNKFTEVLLTPARYIEEPHKFPGNTYTVQLALQGYMIFSGEARGGDYRFFLAVPEDKVTIKEE